MILEAIKPLQTCWSGGRVQVLVQVLAPACHLAISPIGVPEGNRRFRGQNQLPSSWGSSPALLVLVGQESTNTGRFLVCCSCCWHQLALLRKTCYHSCDADSDQESTRFSCLVIFWLWQVFFFFSTWKWKFLWNCQWREVVADQSSAHLFAQSFYQSLIWE